MNILVKGKAVHFDDRYLHVELEDGRLIPTPMSWYKELQEATVKEVTNYLFNLKAFPFLCLKENYLDERRKAYLLGRDFAMVMD